MGLCHANRDQARRYQAVRLGSGSLFAWVAETRVQGAVMARIRTIKPEFFTSADIVDLSPLARLFYIGLWCEADKAGRMAWNPKTLKLRYLPGDGCDVQGLADELVSAGMLVIYQVDGKPLAEIPSFTKHQVINNREAESCLPAPPTVDACLTRESGVKAEGRKEGKEREGREGKDASRETADSTRSPKGSRLAPDWVLPKQWGEWAMTTQSTWTQDHCRQIGLKFGNYWQAKTGKDATKLDWFKTWQNWVLTEGPMKGAAASGELPVVSPEIAKTAKFIESQALTPEQIEANKQRAAAIRREMGGLLKVVS